MTEWTGWRSQEQLLRAPPIIEFMVSDVILTAWEMTGNAHVIDMDVKQDKDKKSLSGGERRGVEGETKILCEVKKKS